MMRIDYSEPKKSYISQPTQPRQRKESAGVPIVVFIVAIIFFFSAGFGGGWFLSQKAAKRSFQAAMEQNSLENSPQKPIPPEPKKTELIQTSPAANSATSGGVDPLQIQQNPNAQATQPVVLSFYKNLPAGQKSIVIGSGVNTKDEKHKQPLQASMPSNVLSDKDLIPSVEEKSPSAISQKNVDTATPLFTVQIASYPLKSEAEQTKGKLVSKGYAAYIVESNQGDKGVWYRVRVGKKMEKSAAKEVASKLGKGALIIPDK